ncbi:hypothetical protein ACOI1C_16210 [Bacillus sp. DJP31]|uniref:hypothetical protein n=1 Tax=Bacillus sp. DJP31 TaxID=3409789 RepID=UPI003BB7E55B
MIKKLFSSLCCIFILLSFGPFKSIQADSLNNLEQIFDQEIDVKEINKNIKFREKMGLKSDQNFVEYLLKNKDSYFEKNSYILTEEEFTEINKRTDMHEIELPKIRNYYRKHY